MTLGQLLNLVEPGIDQTILSALGLLRPSCSVAATPCDFCSQVYLPAINFGERELSSN